MSDQKTRAAAKFRKYSQSPRGRYREQKRRAKVRGVEFLLTFSEWWSIWEESGRYNERGRDSNSYVMARYGDTGPYAIDNVSIIPHIDNVAERNRHYFYKPTFNKSDMTESWLHVHSAADAE